MKEEDEEEDEEQDDKRWYIDNNRSGKSLGFPVIHGKR
jgi:hypothetical protein